MKSSVPYFIKLKIISAYLEQKTSKRLRSSIKTSLKNSIGISGS